MSFDLNRLRRYPSECLPGEEMEPQEIKDLKDGVPNYPMVEIQGPEPSFEHLCCECTGSGVMIGNYPCKVCGGRGYVMPHVMQSQLYAHFVEGQPMSMTVERIIDVWSKVQSVYSRGGHTPYPNERELSLLNTRIAKLKEQLSKELQKKKAERNQFEINQIQQSINTLTKWKLPNKNLTRTAY